MHAQRQVHLQRQVFLPAASEGGRRPPSLVLSPGGRQAPAVAGLMPTPLDLVRAGEALPDYRSGGPDWKIGALALLAASETLMLGRLLRRRRYVRASEPL